MIIYKVYNKINSDIDIYSCVYRECKNKVCNWLKNLTYNEIEEMLN